ncbi:hypothetical protein [Streptomyces sp. NBC_00239]|uniref:hypothetical protein n=1 Tax=Streptomyces sp. NBC_00239 TaxID=2903640 RepID=UPI002E2A78EA|nr:hypothetical protein [Streptomyces sp. NBC_00239]
MRAVPCPWTRSTALRLAGVIAAASIAVVAHPSPSASNSALQTAVSHTTDAPGDDTGWGVAPQQSPGDTGWGHPSI